VILPLLLFKYQEEAHASSYAEGLCCMKKCEENGVQFAMTCSREKAKKEGAKSWFAQVLYKVKNYG
jgi:hypothetical protein